MEKNIPAAGGRNRIKQGLLLQATALLTLSDSASVTGGNLPIHDVDHSVGVVLAHAHRSRIEQENPLFGIRRRGNEAAFRHMRVTEQNSVRPVFFCQKKYLPVPGFCPGCVAVENQEAESAQSDHVLLRRVDAFGTDPQGGVAVAPHDIGGDIGIFAQYGGCIKDTVPEKNDRICLPVVLAQSGADVRRSTVGIGKNENFHKDLPLQKDMNGKMPRDAYSRIKGVFEMKLDRKTVTMLSGMPNDRLWSTLRLFASGMGMELSERKRHRIDYDALRYTLSRITDEDILRVNEISETYKGYSRGGMRR